MALTIFVPLLFDKKRAGSPAAQASRAQRHRGCCNTLLPNILRHDEINFNK